MTFSTQQQRPRSMSLLIFVAAACLVSPALMAQKPRFVVALRGVGIGVEGQGTDVEVVGNYAYLTWLNPFGTNHPGGVQIFDVSDVAAPIWLGGYESREHANAVQVLGHYAYVAGGTLQNETNDTGILEIIDVSNPARPERVSSISTLGRATGVRVVGNLAFVTESTHWTGTNLLGALGIYDVSTPTNLHRIGVYDTAGPAKSVDVSGSHAYLADGITDLQVLDVSDPSKPRRVGGYDVDERIFGAEYGGPATYIQVASNRVYSAGENDFHILDVSTPTTPIRISGHNAVPVYAFHGFEDYVYAVYWSPIRNTFLISVIDVSNPTNLIWVANSPVFVWPRSIQAVGRKLFVAASELLIYELREPPKIRSISCENGTLTIAWDEVPGFKLQRTPSLHDPDWTGVPGSEGQTRIELPITNNNEFFRLVEGQPDW